jgi:AAA domain
MIEASKRFTVTTFSNVASESKDELSLTLSELESRLVNAGPFDSKSQCPLFKLARFGDVRTVKKSLRHNENLLLISGIECDYDGEKISIEEAHRLLKRAGVKALLYTSPSHTAAQPRWRLVCPLLNETKPSYREIFVSWVNGIFAGALAGESFTLSQAFYYGRVRGTNFQYISTLNEASCDFIDLLPKLDQYAIGKVTKAESGQPSGVALFESRVAELGRKLKQGDGKRDLLKTCFVSFAHRGATADELMVFAEGINQKYFADGYDTANIQQLAQASVVNALASGFTDEPDNQPQRYQHLSGSDLNSLPPIEWLIKGLLPRHGLGALYGPSGSGKSFLAIDLAAAIAGNEDRWFDHRVKHAPVLYCALEGEAGIRNRMEAWKRYRSRECPQELRFLLAPFDLMRPTDVNELCESLLPGTVVVLDTLNRASPGADENTSKDMGLILNALKQIEQATGTLVLFVHHTGKDQSKGLRGHSSLFAAIDAAIEVAAEAVSKSFRVAKSKDSEDGKIKHFKLEQVHLGHDEDGDAITSCVVSTFDLPPIGPRLTPQQSLVLQCFHDCDPFGLGVVTDEVWRQKVFAAINSDKPNTNVQAFLKGKKALVEAGIVREGDSGWALCSNEFGEVT